MLQRAYTQLQAITPFYAFPDVDIDRYEVDGQMRQVLLSARELSVQDLNEQSRTWTNTHLRYTHGYGIVASLANTATSAGQPDFLVRDLPGSVQADAPQLEIEQPLAAFRVFTAFPARSWGDRSAEPALSVSRETNRGPRGTLTVPTAARKRRSKTLGLSGSQRTPG